MEDCIGQEIFIDDEVIVQRKFYKELRKQKVINLTPKRVQITDQSNYGGVRNIQSDRVYKIPKPKYGYYRQDEDSHNYVIPEDLVSIFDSFMDEISGKRYIDFPGAFNEFENKFSKYRINGEIYNMKILMRD